MKRPNILPVCSEPNIRSTLAAMTERDESYGAGLAELMNPEVARNPQPIYSMLQASSPVFRLDGVGVIVSSRSGVDEVLRNPDVFSSGVSAHDLKTKRPLIPLQIDQPDHRKYRKLLDPLFAPQRMNVLEESANRLVNQLIDNLIGDEEIDFCTQFSIPFPSQVFLTLFGLPLEELPRFLKMKDGAIRPDQVVGHEFGHPETEAYQQQTADSIYAYFADVIDERRRAEKRDDLISHFLHAEADGDRLTEEEILDICFLFLIAGLDTVTASLDCFFGYLAEHPEVRRKIVDQPDGVPAMVEEMLRWETPVMGCARVATRDTKIGEFAICEGEQVMGLLGAANVDEAEFSEAGSLVWDRDANRHLAFGGGIHRCLGSHLARLELRVALREWHSRIPDYRIKPGVELNYTAGIRTIDSFPMLLGATS
jgi:cytochrome P450